MEFRKQVTLANYTTFGIGGPACWFATAKTEDNVVEADCFAREQQQPLFVLGGGSNVLVADRGFAGLVLHMQIAGVEGVGIGGLAVGAGENWDRLVQYTVDRGLAGMECLAGIPGTVGGTPVQNVGAYGQEVSETIRTVRAWDTQEHTFVDLSSKDCGFAYRTSLLNTSARGRYIVTRVDFSLTPDGPPHLQYADLQKVFAGKPKPTLPEVAEVVRGIRRTKSMVIDPADPNSRSAGSFFRNPIIPAELLAAVAAAGGVAESAMPHWAAGNGCVKVPAAWLLEHAGFVRGYTMGNAGISTRHTLALVNRGGATAEEIEALRNRITTTVQERFGVMLEQEPVSLG